jgi:uncharacterized protein (TIGR02996 family)
MTAADLDRAALLLAIVTDPADDVPRLAMADWLEENGQPERAELIRIQVAMHRHDTAPAPRVGAYIIRSRRLKMQARERELLGRVPVFAGVPPAVEAWTVARGFVSHVSLPLAAWLEHGPRLVRGHPITAVRASDRVPADAQEAGWSAAGVGWYRWQESEWRDPEDIPEHIWLHVPGEADAEAGRWKLFTDPAAAHAALSLALVNLARDETGLPPLEGTP